MHFKSIMELLKYETNDFEMPLLIMTTTTTQCLHPAPLQPIGMHCCDMNE